MRSAAAFGGWRSWYDFFPWEDWRSGRPELIENAILPGLDDWVDGGARRHFLLRAFAPRARQSPLSAKRGFNEENVLERYELLYEAGLVEEALSGWPRSGGAAGVARRRSARRCAMTIAEFLPPPWAGFAPK